MISLPLTVSYPETLVIVKRYKTDQFSPADVQGDPAQFFSRLFRGFVTIDCEVRPLNTRDIYGRNISGFRQGRFTYTVACVFNQPAVLSFSGVILRRELGLFDEEEVGSVPLPEARPGDYSKIEFPPQLVSPLLHHTLIFGGQTDDVEPLRELYIGGNVRERLKACGMIK